MKPDQLPSNAEQLYTASMEWLDSRWDDNGLRLDPALSYRGNTKAESPRYIRETAYYCLGLFLRGDTDRAVLALEQVLRCQSESRESEHVGCFLRHPEETFPKGKVATEWVDYDPDWREYIGATLAIILCEFSQQLPKSVLRRTDAALRRATAGSLWRRVPADYTAVAMLKAFLLAFTGTRYDQKAWLEGGDMQSREIFRLFKTHRCFPSYNSPTDYGSILFALALWRKYSPSHAMQSMAAEMEASLWKDIAQFYHAGMGNLAGPYDRAYGMDMRSYASPLGLCIWASVGRERAPFPALSKSFPQHHELAFSLPMVIAGVAAPTEALPDLVAFRGNRQLERVVGSNDSTGAPTTVSAWLGKELMLGAKSPDAARKSLKFSPHFASYPATIHWLSGNQMGWMCAQFPAEINALAKENTLTIDAANSSDTDDLLIRFLIYSPSPPIFTLDKWSFPSLTVHVSSNLSFSAPAERGELFEIECRLPSAQSEAGLPARALNAYVTLTMGKADAGTSASPCLTL